MGYRFEEGFLDGRTRLIAYAIVLVVFVFAIVSLTSNNSAPASSYIIAKQQQEPASQGTSVTQIDQVQRQLDRLKSDIFTFSSNLTSCYSDVAGLIESLQECKTEEAYCNTDLTKLSANKSAVEQTCLNEKTGLQLNISVLEEKSTELSENLSTTEKERDNYKEGYDALALNTANNICCKAKVDNPKIKFYEVVNDKILCTEDSGLAIKC